MAYLKADVSGEPGESGEQVVLSEPDSPVLQDLHNGLLVAYVWDEGDQFCYVQNDHLRQEGVSESQLHASGICNLHRLAKERMRIHDLDGVYGVLADGNFEASLLLLDTLWERDLRGMVETGFAAAVPARDILVFCDRDSQEGIAKLRSVIERVWPRGDHLISRSVYVREQGAWHDIGG